MNTPPKIPPHQPSTQSSEELSDDARMRALIPIGKSRWSIAAGWLGLASVLFIPAPFAVICSIIAILEIRKSKGTDNEKRGMGRAVFGLVMGLIFSAFIICGVMKTLLLLLVSLVIWLFYELIAAWRSGIFKTRFQFALDSDFDSTAIFNFLGPRVVTSREKDPKYYWMRMGARMLFLGLILVGIISWTVKR